MPKEYDFEVTFSYYEGDEPKQAHVTLKARSEVEALEKAKEKYSVHAHGNNYQPIPSASIMRK